MDINKRFGFPGFVVTGPTGAVPTPYVREYCEVGRLTVAAAKLACSDKRNANAFSGAKELQWPRMRKTQEFSEGVDRAFTARLA
jgi:hypothetical protein